MTGCRAVLAFAALTPLLAAAPQNADRRFLIVLIGPTGSGKATQADFLRKRFGIPTLAADDLIRQHPDALRQHVTDGIDPGPQRENPALDQLVADALKNIDLSKGVALDGYPATKDQADHLEAWVKKAGLRTIIIQLDVPDRIARERLKRRAGPDDTPQQIEQRLKDYHRELDMLRDYYPEANIWTVDGTKSPSEVSNTIESILVDQVPRRLAR
jgi:adenylate kinase